MVSIKLCIIRWSFTEYYGNRMPADRTWLGINLLTDLVNVLDVAIVRPRLASIDKEDGEIITGELICLSVRLFISPSQTGLH